MKYLPAIICFLFITIISSAQTSSPCKLLCNGNFENLNYTPPAWWAVNGGVQQPFVLDAVNCWKNTAETCVEVWRSGTNQNIQAVSGRQFAEVNCNQNGSLYQDFSALAGTKVTVSYYHRGRIGGMGGVPFDNQLLVSIGPVGGTMHTEPVVMGLTNAWTAHTFTYICPPSGTGYRLSFTSNNTAGFNQVGGNFLDSISVNCPTYDPCCPPWNKEVLMDMLRYEGSGSATSPYTVHFVPSTLLNDQMQTYINYLHLIQPPISKIVINWRLSDQTTNTTVGSQVFTSWAAGTSWTAGSSVPPTTSIPNFFPLYPMQVSRWYKVHTGIYLENQNFFPASCANNDIYVRVTGNVFQLSYDMNTIISSISIP